MDPKAREQAGARWLCALRAGEWVSAWRETDAMEADRRAGAPRQPHHLHWDGTPFEARTVLVRCEHGLGDTLQFLRFVPLVQRQARRLHLMVQPPLVELLRGAPGLGEVHNGWLGPDWPAHEVEIEVMELAYAFRATPPNVPAPYPHLAERCARRRFRLPDDGRLRVGLLWASSDWDPTRSIPWPVLQPLLALDHLQFIALQQGPAAQDADRAPSRIEPLWRRTAAAEDAAAAMLQMDLVIGIDGMPAHLAGMLGRPTWLLLKHQADWRWMEGRSDSPWYPTMRLFRQPARDDWRGVVREVVEAARCLPSRKAAARLPATQD